MIVNFQMQNTIFWKTFPVIKLDVMGLSLLLLKPKVFIKEEKLLSEFYCNTVFLYKCLHTCYI